MGNDNAAEIGTDEDFVDELKPGTQLMHGQFTIESFLNAGGFGITYLAKDSLDRKIVIKECFPGAFCRRSRSIVQARSRAHQKELNSMVRLFVQEAKSLAKLDHPNIVGVHQVFEDNDTAYMALDFVEGRDMLDTMDDPTATMSPAQVKSMLIDVLGAVGFIHSQDILHRDISPDNILIDPTGRPVLIDFGAAREEATKQSRVLSALSVVKDGYSPQEFYIAGSDQNPSSDLYALGASFYHFIKGEVPPNSQARLASIASGEKDPYVPLKGAIEGFDANFLGAIDKSLEVLPKNRVQSAQEWLDMMEGKALPSPVAPKTSGATVAKAVAATAPAKESKSKVGLLMASAAAIAVVGVGVAFSAGVFGGADEGDVTVTTAQTESTETDVATETDIADAATEGDAQVEPELTAEAALAEVEAAAAEAQLAAAAEAARAAAEELAAAEETRVAEAEKAAEEARIARAAEFAALAAENEARRVAQAEERAEAFALREAAEAEAIVQAEAAAAAQALAEQQAAAASEARALAEAQALQEAQNAAEAEASAIAQAEAEAAQAAAEEAAQLAAAEAEEAARKAASAALAAATLDTPTPPIEASELITLAGIAGAPDLPVAAFNAKLPIDVALGAVVADDQIESLANGAVVPAGADTPNTPTPAGADPALPEFLASAPAIGVDGFTGFILPGDADGIVTVTLPLTESIPAFFPGNEIITAVPEESFVLSAWSVELPFGATSSSSRVIGNVAPVAPIWVDEGVEIDTVNGRSINSIDGISDVLRSSVDLTDEDQLSISFGIKDEATGGLVEKSWLVPIIQKTALLNGIGFETRLVGDEWITTVTDAPEAVAGDLKVGDQVIAYMRTSERVNERTSLKTIMDREIADGQSLFSFAVNRDGSMWIASLDYADNSQ